MRVLTSRTFLNHFLLLLFCSFAALGCGSGISREAGTAGQAAAGKPESITISGLTGTTLTCGAHVQLTATSNVADFVPAWSVQGAGAISATGLYSSPPCATQMSVSVSAADPSSGQTTSVAFQVVPAAKAPSETILITSPASGTVSCGQSLTFTATSNLSNNFSPVWSVLGGGSINQSGTYTAPACPSSAVVSVVATDTQTADHATASLQVLSSAPTPSEVITISGANDGKISCGQSIALNAQSTYSPFTPVWFVNGAGSISATGIYSAPSCPNQSIVSIGVVNSADAAKSSLALTITEPIPVLSTVSPQTFSPGLTINAVVSGSGFDSSSVASLNGTALPTVALSTQSLAVQISPLPNAISSGSLTVVNGSGAVSAALTVPVTVTYDAADRFLQQASWGATPALIAHVQAIGLNGYLTEQFSSTEDSYTDSNFQHVPENFWWASTLHEQTQLRTKVGWAWYKLFNSPGSTVTGMLSAVPNITNRDAFASFSTLLGDVSSNIEMGLYFNYCCFDYSQAVSGNHPDENFGRELMQQFTVGPYLLNSDGTYQTDDQGVPLPISTQADVASLARSFTGLAYVGDAFAGADPEGLTPMISGDPTNHDTSAKNVLGQVVPSGMDAASELLFVANQLASNPNTGIHLSKYLIHELVTSNPSPAYVKRVAQVWANDGSGHQGNLQAVVQAILLDPEARAGDDPGVQLEPSYGRFRDPVNYETTLMRQFGAVPLPGIPLIGTAEATASLSHEAVFSAPSVFGYYSDYNLLSNGLLAPEAQLYTGDAILQRANFATYVFGLPGGPTAGFPSVNWSSWEPLAGGDGSALLDAWNHLCFHGRMSASLYSALQINLQSIPETDLLTRVGQTAYLLVMSPEYMVED